MENEYKKFYEEHFTPQRYKNYKNEFETYSKKFSPLSTSPLFIKNSMANNIIEKVMPALIRLLDSKEYQNEIYERGWFLPKHPVEIKDFFGCADFHIDNDKLKLIELNFFIPGVTGFLELIPKLFSKNFKYEFHKYSDGFEKRLADFLYKRFNSKKIALAVNHLSMSEVFFEHYRYLEKLLNKNGLEVKLVYAKDAKISPDNKPMWDNIEYDGVFNILIPRIWEHHAKEFENYTALYKKIPHMIFPNPWCWTMGDKRFLTVLSNLDNKNYGLSKEDCEILKEITLKTEKMDSFKNTKDLIEKFEGDENIVLKPIDNYRRNGVYIKPDTDTISKVFNNERSNYIVQEYFPGHKSYYIDENMNQVDPFKTILRTDFFNGEFYNFRGLGYKDPLGTYYLMPVAIRELMEKRFLDTKPLYYTKKYTKEFDCDIALPSWAALGSMVIFTRLIEAMALEKGRALKVLSAPHFYTKKAKVSGESKYPILEENPYIKEIVNADLVDLKIMREITNEMDNCPQLGHITENICAPWGLRPRKLHGDIYLNKKEKQAALEKLSHLPRPLVALCPYGNSSPLEDSLWYEKKWQILIKKMKNKVSFFQIGHDAKGHKDLPVFTPKDTTVREMMALIWASDIYVGFDTGPSHIAAAFEKPALVIWDAVRKTKLEDAKQPGFSLATLGRWTYPHTKNITLLGEREDEAVEWIMEFILESSGKFKKYDLS